MEYMEQALSLAKLALGQSSPNPAVGAVVVNNDEVVGQGYTQPAGSHHAEIKALQQAREKARGGALYVTLEPCCHYGRTPPCTRAIIESGIAEVYMATLDVNPLVCGRGKEELEKEGIKVHVGDHEDEAREIVEAYMKYITTGRPFVTAKFAASLDGKIATRSGDSRWVSGEESRKYVHYLRYINDAIMAGANTILMDDPRLTTRCCGGRGGTAKKQPLRVVVDGSGRILPKAHLFTEPGSTLVVRGGEVEPQEKAGFEGVDVELMELPSKEGMVDPLALLKALGEREITSVLVEGGGILFGSLFDRGLVDKVIAFIAPIIIGGAEAKTAVAGRGVELVADSLRLQRVRVEALGEDLMVIGYIER
jgi:diaminohydroxyphosphoribosylaminopyrimidine deaminase/5-amino-6-(5-phosphoribosylamino)uracil reductase